MKLKPSRYNHMVDINGKLWGFQGRTCALAQFDRPVWELLQQDTVIDLNPETLQMLSAGFVLPADVDETQMFRHSVFSSRYKTDSLELIIAPTMDCNMACSYCFESGVEPVTMTNEVAERIINLVSTHSDHIRTLKTIWYGGEPLLAMDMIRSITIGLQEILTRQHIRHESMVITNGTLLTNSIAGELKELGIDRVQVTIDGSATLHDRERRLKDGGKSWDLIMDNVFNAAHLVEIPIRATLTPEEMSELGQLCQELDDRNMPENVRVVPAPKKDMSCSNSGCGRHPEFTRVLFSYILSMGFNPRINLAYPQPRKGCMATRSQCHLIDPHGDLHRCFEYAGRREYAIGNLEQEVHFSYQFQRWLETDPFESSPECVDCKWLPQCYGGCPSDYMNSASRSCVGMKGNMELFVQVWAMLMQNSKSV